MELQKPRILIPLTRFTSKGFQSDCFFELGWHGCFLLRSVLSFVSLSIVVRLASDVARVTETDALALIRLEMTEL